MGKAIDAADGITGSQLKWIALTAMLIDHIALTIILDSVSASTGPVGRPIEILYYALKVIGRLAFPLFCFLLVEGFLHTHSRRAYFRNLVVFALISEIPFDLANNDKVLDFYYQNVFFTLSLGMLANWFVEHFQGKRLQQFLCVSGCTAAAFFLATDYSVTGVVLIFIFYQFRDRHKQMFLLGGIWLFIGTFLENILFFAIDGTFLEDPASSLFLQYLIGSSVELCGAFSFLFISRYNGKRGKSLPKYLFYAFYPCHLIILTGISKLLLYVGWT